MAEFQAESPRGHSNDRAIVGARSVGFGDHCEKQLVKPPEEYAGKRLPDRFKSARVP